jgi:hypothetical protein
MEVDYTGWQGAYIPAATPYPTPASFSCHQAVNGCDTDIMLPNQVFGTGFMRMEWTGASDHSVQYIHLTNYAAPGMNFENVGCAGSLTAPATYGPLSETAGDWGCYSYLRLYTYLNFGANGGTPSNVSQTISLFDGTVTVTSGTINVECLGQAVCCNNFEDHLTVSLNYLANQYDIATGHYFDIQNIKDVIINAPQTDYTYGGLKLPTVPSAFANVNSRSLFMYYDHLILGDHFAVPYYQSPALASVTVTTATGGPGLPVIGAYIGWTALTPAQVTPEIPVTAYHVFRSLSSTKGVGPYISVGIAPSGAVAVTQFVDTQNMGGAISCYKVLTCNNGPTSDPLDEKLNTVNATYNEPRLMETIVVEQCGYVAARPTLTNTPNGTPTMTWTPGFALPTNTPIPQPTGTLALSSAHVYPNPFNPIAYQTPSYGIANEDAGEFHVDNVQPKTEVHIYSMDGQLVKDGVTPEFGSRFSWDGKNKNGSRVVSGLYYLVLKDPKNKKTAVFRIIVCYKCNPVYTP